MGGGAPPEGRRWGPLSPSAPCWSAQPGRVPCGTSGLLGHGESGLNGSTGTGHSQKQAKRHRHKLKTEAVRVSEELAVQSRFRSFRLKGRGLLLPQRTSGDQDAGLLAPGWGGAGLSPRWAVPPAAPPPQPRGDGQDRGLAQHPSLSGTFRRGPRTQWTHISGASLEWTRGWRPVQSLL